MVCFDMSMGNLYADDWVCGSCIACCLGEVSCAGCCRWLDGPGS